MEDIYDAIVVCDICQGNTQKGNIHKDGFLIRNWECFGCHKQWYHPLDLENYRLYTELKKKEFQVKLRSVGNSWIVSIPKEIIRFEEIQTTKIVNLHLDQPGKVVLRFSHIRKVY